MQTNGGSFQGRLGRAIATHLDSVLLSQNPFKCMSTRKKRATRMASAPVVVDRDPLLRVLVAKAARQGLPLKDLASQLGVTYERLAQWRRGKSTMKTAHRSVHECAARYLEVPVVLVLVLGGVVKLHDFIWPEDESLERRLRQELEAMRHDPFVAAFVPESLQSAAPEVQLFAAFLYRQLQGSSEMSRRGPAWMSALHRVIVAQAHGAADMDEPATEANLSGLF